MDFKEFLIEAKKNGYANSDEVQVKKFKDGAKEFIYKKGKWLYRDRYFGFSPFIGQEIVWKDGKAVWIMNYLGEILKDTISAKEIYSFLKKALFYPDLIVPVRGPQKFEDNNFKYVNIGGGLLDKFRYTEIIFYKGERVYELECHGGMIK
jgi:hypothetical protein